MFADYCFRCYSSAARADALMDELFEQLQDDTRSFWQSPNAIRRLDAMPPATTFFRDYVATSTPVIISGGVSGWNAARSWNDLVSLADENPELEVTVDFTPDGRGDCVVDVGLFEQSSQDDDGRGACRGETAAPCDGGAGGGAKFGATVFVKPEERIIKFAAFVDMLSTAAEAAPSEDGFGGEPAAFRGVGSQSSSKGSEVPYLSHQVRISDYWPAGCRISAIVSFESAVVLYTTAFHLPASPVILLVLTTTQVVASMGFGVGLGNKQCSSCGVFVRSICARVCGVRLVLS